MRINIKKYIRQIKNFNPFNYFLKKKIQSLELSKTVQNELIIAFKIQIVGKAKQIKILEEKIGKALILIDMYGEQLTNLRKIGG